MRVQVETNTIQYQPSQNLTGEIDSSGDQESRKREKMKECERVTRREMKAGNREERVCVSVAGPSIDLFWLH